jgi:hypothetical protein
VTVLIKKRGREKITLQNEKIAREIVLCLKIWHPKQSSLAFISGQK